MSIEEIIKIKLSIGMAIKNYKEMCILLEEKEKKGKSRLLQIANWERYFKWHKDGQKFIIDEVFEMPIEKIDNRGISKGSRNNNRKYFPNFLISEEDENKIGVYKIILDTNIYIGSTIQGFRKRFTRHNNKINNKVPFTSEMLEDGAIIEIVEICEGLTEPQVRDLENKYIKQYREDNDWNLINSRDAWDFAKKQKYKTIRIKVKEEEYNKVLKFLQDNNLVKELI